MVEDIQKILYSTADEPAAEEEAAPPLAEVAVAEAVAA